MAMVDSEEISDLEKCTRQHALSAEKSAKFLSSLQKAGQSTAESAS